MLAMGITRKDTVESVRTREAGCASRVVGGLEAWQSAWVAGVARLRLPRSAGVARRRVPRFARRAPGPCDRREERQEEHWRVYVHDGGTECPGYDRDCKSHGGTAAGREDPREERPAD